MNPNVFPAILRFTEDEAFTVAQSAGGGGPTTHLGEVTLTGIGILAAVASNIISAAASLTGVGTFNSLAANIHGAAAELTGNGTLSANAILLTQSTFEAILGASGSLTTFASLLQGGEFTGNPDGSFGVVASVLNNGEASFTGTGTVNNVVALLRLAALATLQGQGNLAISPSLILPGSLAYSTSGTLGLNPSVLNNGECDFLCGGDSSVLATVFQGGVITLEGIGSLVSSGQLTIRAACELLGIDTLICDSYIFNPRDFEVLLFVLHITQSRSATLYI